MNRPESPSSGELYSIAELAAEFGISTRAIRFYESKRLISPDRVGTVRVFRRRDRARLMLILRGKRLGFSLRDVADYLSLYEADPEHNAQNSLLLDKVTKRLAALERQLADLTTTISELREIRQLAEARLAERRLTVSGNGGRDRD
jgi:DNA-binding transcriptional MerR regulator